MQQLSKLLEEQEFESIEEANAFLEQFQGKPLPEMAPLEDDPIAQAEELIYEAYDATSRKRSVELAREALELWPDCADAYVLLAEADARTPTEALEYYRKGVEAGERALGHEAFEEAVGHFWGITETRPYMRARQGLAEVLWYQGDRDAAIDHYRDMLRLNPGDNQGIRYLLLDILMETERYDEVDELLEAYDNDASARWQYTRALLLFHREGESPEANDQLEEAIGWNAHVPVFLLGKKRLPKQRPPYVGIGDENEAVEYALDARSHWQNTFGALKWLRKKTSGR